MNVALLAAAALSMFAAGGLPGEDLYLKASEAARTGRHADAARDFALCAEEPGPLAAYTRVKAATSRARGGDHAGGANDLTAFLGTNPVGPWADMARVELARVHGPKAAPVAAPLLDAVLAAPLKPRWLRDLLKETALLKLGHADTAAAGYADMAEWLAGARLHRDKAEAAAVLEKSDDPAHRLLAAGAFLDANEPKKAEASLLFLAAREAALDPESRAAFLFLHGRHAFDTRQPATGMNRMQTLMTEFAGTPWALRAEARLLREELAKPDTADSAETALRGFIGRNPGEHELAELLHWRGGRLAAAKRTAAAAQTFLLLAETCPDHERAEHSVMRAGDLYRGEGNQRDALAAYRLLIERFPSGALMPEAAYRAGSLLEDAGDNTGAVEVFAAGARGALGDWFMHRCLDRLERYGRDEGLAAEGVTLAGGRTWVRPRAGSGPVPVGPPDPAWNDQAWFQRLRFFGHHGLEEAEWEALYLGRELAGQPAAADVLRCMSEAGVSATAMQFARQLGLGEEAGGPSPERLAIDYPLAYWQLVTAKAAETGLDPLLIVAVMRQESLFQARVSSHAGAAGLMQLMPATARWMAEVEPAVANEHAEDLLIPSHSIRLGAYYLRRMISTHDGNLVFAIASYNGGPGNVRKWRRERPTTDMVAFIDGIPFEETRGFVRKVLGNYMAYKSLYQNLFNE